MAIDVPACDINSKGYLRLILAHLVCSSEVIGTVREYLQPDIFSRSGEEPYQLLWATSSWYYGKYGSTIPKDVLRQEIVSRLASDPNFMSHQDQKLTMELVEVMYDIPSKGIAVDYIIERIQELLDDRILRHHAQVTARAGSSEDLEQKVTELEKARSSSRITGMTACTELFAPGPIVFPSGVKVPTGVACFDRLLGGIRPHEVIGVMMPTGSGKTTLATMVAVNMIKLHKHNVAMLAYENEIDPEYRYRTLGYGASIPREVLGNLQGNITEQLDDKYNNQVQDFLRWFSPHFLPYDFVKAFKRGHGRGGVGEIRQLLEAADRRGQHIDLIIIDQLMMMADKYMDGHNINISERRVVMQRIVSELETLVSPSNMACSAIVLHQSRTDVKDRPATVKPRKGDGAEFRAFEDFLQGCIAGGKKDENGLEWLASVKAREGAENAIVVKVHEDYRLEWTPDDDGRYVPGPVNFRDTRMESEGEALPSEDTNKKKKPSRSARYDLDDTTLNR